MPAYIFSSWRSRGCLRNRHWLSDAVFGSAVGIIAGRTVTRHGHDFPVAVATVPEAPLSCKCTARARDMSFGRRSRYVVAGTHAP